MNENVSAEVTTDQVSGETLSVPDQQPVDTETPKKLDDIITILHSQDNLSTQVNTPNGSSFVFVQKVTLGEILIASAVFLLLTFQVIKWLLGQVWGKAK